MFQKSLMILCSKNLFPHFQSCSGSSNISLFVHVIHVLSFFYHLQKSSSVGPNATRTSRCRETHGKWNGIKHTEQQTERTWLYKFDLYISFCLCVHVGYLENAHHLQLVCSLFLFPQKGKTFEFEKIRNRAEKPAFLG